ncbi:AAA family ATPase [Photobacterium damselae]|uniref:AAA family ATPase n=1 Tax=Photobacterium damselae TaxID=38293 RepID=UPI001F38488B|nr:AAA family ATPase [Photobacterium damselae]
MIKGLKLHNFKAYKDQAFNFGELTIFCGNNSVGKSTAIQAISIPLQSYFKINATLNGELSEIGTVDDIHHNKAEDSKLSITLMIDDEEFSWGYDDIEEQEKYQISIYLLILIITLKSYLFT